MCVYILNMLLMFIHYTLYFIYVYIPFYPLVLLSDTSKVFICVFILACSMMLNRLSLPVYKEMEKHATMFGAVDSFIGVVTFPHEWPFHK